MGSAHRPNGYGPRWTCSGALHDRIFTQRVSELWLELYSSIDIFAGIKLLREQETTQFGYGI